MPAPPLCLSQPLLAVLVAAFVRAASAAYVEGDGAEALLVLEREEKGLDHLGAAEVAEAVQLVEPELVAAEVSVGRIVGIASEIAEVLHQDEGRVELPV